MSWFLAKLMLRPAGKAPGPFASLLCLPTDRAAYGRLSRLLTLGKSRAPKAQCRLTLDDLVEHGAGQILVALPAADDADITDRLRPLRRPFRGRLYLAALGEIGEERRGEDVDAVFEGGDRVTLLGPADRRLDQARPG